MLYKDKFPPGTFYGFNWHSRVWLALEIDGVHSEVILTNGQGYTSHTESTGECPNDLIKFYFLPPEFLTCQ
jgi:hypothetical protein